MNDSIRKLASEALTYFVHSTRTNGGTYWRCTQGTPEWVSDLCYAAHNDGQMGPDDWRYEFIQECLSAIVDETEDDLEADIYTHQLTAWLASRADRYCYVDDAVQEYGGEPGSIIDQLMLGQLQEKREVMSQIVYYLEQRQEELEDDLDDDPLTEEDFYDVYEFMADEGKCDSPGGSEYKRVLDEWEKAGRPENIREFIDRETNLYPEVE